MQRNTKKITLTLPEKLIEQLEEISKESAYSKSFIVRLALLEFMKKQKGESDIE